ncbi:MAG: Hpt domain-containing protein [Epsilonproteobacteria bacterium]|nr:Hpt domain-containing protein [Campylobacterota bacterium]
MNPLLEQFLLEARENLAFIDQNIENIGGDDPELLNSVFRAAHTLKGGSGIVGFEAVKRITHHAEDLLDMLRSGNLEFKPIMIESLFNAFDEVVNLIEAAEECGDIVDADESRIDQIAQELSGLMGKTIEEQTWSCPFRLASDVERVVNIPMPFLRQFNQTIPFKVDVIDEAFCAKEQLYAIVFDLDESCMVYGNDPLYTLSLIGDKVLGIHACMGENASKALLSGFDDPDGLLLRLSMTAFVYATYEEISDALFNFVDELSFIPLDIVTLLQISEGEAGHALDVLKELSAECSRAIDSHNRVAISEKIHNTLPLIGRDTLQSMQLRRFDEVLNTIKDTDLGLLKSFFAQLPQGNVYAYNALLDDTSSVEAVGASDAICETIPLNELDQIQLKAILLQQLEILEMVDDDASQERVLSILENNLKPYICDMPSSFDSKEAMMEWLRCEISGEENTAVQELVAVSQTPAVETTIITAAKPEEVKVYSPPVQAVPEVIAVASSTMVERADSDNQLNSSKKGVIGKTVKVDQESIDHLMNVVGELLVAKNSLPYLADGVHKMTGEVIKRAIMEKYTFINRLAEQLQDLIMSMRMLPISYVFDRYPKLVRDISKNMNKKVTLSMDGGETKLDKNMIEMLADPMIHIMRNSLDHGIEMPDVRIQKGKNPEGHIALNAYAQSDKIIIEIRDDGAGINIGRVVQKVLEKELLTLEQVEAMSDDEKAALVMLPGLSTAETISEYSGRGVGMDVVRKSIEGFGGTIRIKTIPNQGTTIYLSIP